MQNNYFQKQRCSSVIPPHDLYFKDQGSSADTHSTSQQLIVILRLSEVMAMVGLRKSEIYKRMANKQFPDSVSLGGRAVGWLLHEIQQWLADLIQQSRSVPTRPNGGGNQHLLQLRNRNQSHRRKRRKRKRLATTDRDCS